MFYAPLTAGVIIAGHDRRHSGGKPELSASERRKRLLPFQLTAAAEGERIRIFDKLVFKLPFFFNFYDTWNDTSGCCCWEGLNHSQICLSNMKLQCGDTWTPARTSHNNKTWRQNMFENKAQPCWFSLEENSCQAVGMSKKETSWCVENPYLNLRETLWQHKEIASNLSELSNNDLKSPHSDVEKPHKVI